MFWYGLMLLCVVWDRPGGLAAAFHMGMVGMAGAGIYKMLKTRTSRPRPYRKDPGIRCGALPLDEFSFPSGHTLHAVAFSLVAVAYYPALAWLLAPFTVLVALSRMVLGLHYPSDVLAGAVIGFGLAKLSFWWLIFSFGHG